jgi:hypothetical protein
LPAYIRQALDREDRGRLAARMLDGMRDELRGDIERRIGHDVIEHRV